MARRQVMRRNRKKNSNYRVNLLYVIVIICVAVAAGYFTTQYFIYPIILGESIEEHKTEPGDEQLSQVTGESAENSSANLSEQQTVNEQQTPNEQQTSDVTQSADIQQVPAVIEDKLAVGGYCIQYGSFSEKDSAENLVIELKNSGIEAEIVEKGGLYKVIGELFATKEEASLEKEKHSAAFKDVFITQI